MLNLELKTGIEKVIGTAGFRDNPLKVGYL
jgi:hypothetical protein